MSKGIASRFQMLSAKGDEIDCVLGFELGADYYMIKPLSPKELVLRIRALLRKKDTFAEQLVKKGPVTIDFARFIVSVNVVKLDLTAMELKLFTLVGKCRGQNY